MEVAVVDFALMSFLGKEAAAANKTVRSGTVRVDDDEGKQKAKDVMDAGLKPASHVAPTRYGRKPYSRGMTRDSS